MVRGGSNQAPLSMYPKLVYFVCDSRFHPERTQEECLTQFQMSYPHLPEPLAIGATDDMAVWVSLVLDNQLEENIVLTNKVVEHLLDPQVP